MLPQRIVALYTPKFSSTNSKSSLTVLAINEILISLISRFEESPVKSNLQCIS